MYTCSKYKGNPPPPGVLIRKVKLLLRGYKVELKPTPEQIEKINQNIGVCRWLYNQYIAYNNDLYKQYQDGLIDKKDAFCSGYEFDKYINNNVKSLEEYDWINSCGSKARKKAIMNAEMAFKRFFKGLSGYPRFKKKTNQDIGLYFTKTSKNVWKIERHRINVPTFKWIRLKQFGYIPSNANVRSGTISRKGDKYFVSLLVECDWDIPNVEFTEGLGIDLGLKNLAVISNGTVKKNINKTKRVKKLEKKLKREQRKLSRKYESSKSRNKSEEGNATKQNIQNK